MKTFILSLLGVVFAIAYLFFALTNREVVLLDLAPLPYLLEIRLFVFVSALLLLGMLVGWFVASFGCRRRHMIQRQTVRKIEALENEVTALRARSQLPDDSPAHHSR